jgi:hypothetical protein
LKNLLSIGLILLLASVVNGEPRHRWWKDKTNLVIIAVAAGSSLFRTHEIANCRGRNDIVHCPDGGYGPFHAREGLDGGITILTTGLTIYGREHWHHGWKDELINDFPVAAWSSWNLAVGVSDRNVPNFPREDATRFRVTK